jgi:hypothetical protein
MTENCLKVGVRSEAWKVARCVNERGARRARDWRAGNRRFLVAVRTLRLIVDMVVNWIEKGDSELEKGLHASPGKFEACSLLVFYGWTELHEASAMIGTMITCQVPSPALRRPHFFTGAQSSSNFTPISKDTSMLFHITAIVQLSAQPSS